MIGRKKEDALFSPRRAALATAQGCQLSFLFLMVPEPRM
jgi:hypothetical protein